MTTQDITLCQAEVHKLLSAANPDAAFLYLFTAAGNDPNTAPAALGFSEGRLSCAVAVLRQLGLWTDRRTERIIPGQRPCYTETDVTRAMGTMDFQGLRDEVERVLGRNLVPEDLKILLGLRNYLNLPPDVISVLVNYCKDRARRKGNLRSPSLRTIEKEAYGWAERGIDTLEEAAAYIQAQNIRFSRMGRLKQQLQIYGRNLTAAEERYAQSWLDMDFGEGCIQLAYERTCLNTGGLNWNYMNKILTRWHEQGLHTLDAIRAGDQKKAAPQGASGQLGSAELEAIQRTLREG